jgi:hypothetical protein
MSVLTNMQGLGGLGWILQSGPVAVEYVGGTNWSVPAGIFSTADLLLEDVLAQEPPTLNPSGRNPFTVNLNHDVWNVTKDHDDPMRFRASTAMT